MSKSIRNLLFTTVAAAVFGCGLFVFPGLAQAGAMAPDESEQTSSPARNGRLEETGLDAFVGVARFAGFFGAALATPDASRANNQCRQDRMCGQQHAGIRAGARQ